MAFAPTDPRELARHYRDFTDDSILYDLKLGGRIACITLNRAPRCALLQGVRAAAARVRRLQPLRCDYHARTANGSGRAVRG